jgi:Ca2+-binding RTX toxin-like protein
MLHLSWPRFVACFRSRAQRAATPACRYQAYRPALEVLEHRLVMTGMSMGPPPGPLAQNQTLGAMTDSSTVLNILQYVSDPNPGATLNPASVTIVTPPTVGSAVPDPTTGLILYTPTPIPMSRPSDSFQYTVTDSLGLVSNVGTITLFGVSPVFAGYVVAQPLTVTTVTLEPVDINVFGNVQVNDGSVADLSSVTIQGTAQGSFSLNTGTGILTYTPAFGFEGFQVVQYQVKSTDGHTSNLAELYLIVLPTPPRLQADPLGGTMLVVEGTAGNDTININPGRHPGDVMVTINGITSGPFRPTSRIVAFGYGGNNTITVSSKIRLPTWLDGVDGNSILEGGGGNNVLIGGTGNDTLIGRGTHDLLIGGGGQDVLMAQGQNDLVISGSTAFDSDQTALAAILSEWTSPASYAQRVDALTDYTTGPAFSRRLNSNYFLVPATMQNPTIQNDNFSNLVLVGSGRDLLLVNDSGPNADIVLSLPSLTPRYSAGPFFAGINAWTQRRL